MRFSIADSGNNHYPSILSFPSFSLLFFPFFFTCNSRHVTCQKVRVLIEMYCHHNPTISITVDYADKKKKYANRHTNTHALYRQLQHKSVFDAEMHQLSRCSNFFPLFIYYNILSLSFTFVLT